MQEPSNRGLAVVTGASSGIGAAYARYLAARGHSLLLVARRRDRLEALGRDLADAHNVAVEPLVADLSKPAGLRAVEARVAAANVGFVVNNAGAGGLGPIANRSADAVEALIRLNVVAVTRLSQAALAGFRDRNAGTLVNIGSIVAFHPSAGGAAYGATKAFVLNFTRALAAEYQGGPIRIQVVMPGPIRTEFFSSQGLSDDIFPAGSYIAPDALVGAAMTGLAAGEIVTTPTLVDDEAWRSMEAARAEYLTSATGGRIAARYG